MNSIFLCTDIYFDFQRYLIYLQVKGGVLVHIYKK
jgi:hypothetical protein